jgi:hypothetical protein
MPFVFSLDYCKGMHKSVHTAQSHESTPRTKHRTMLQRQVLTFYLLCLILQTGGVPTGPQLTIKTFIRSPLVLRILPWVSRRLQAQAMPLLGRCYTSHSELDGMGSILRIVSGKTIHASKFADTQQRHNHG